jgi:hypothetical protein
MFEADAMIQAVPKLILCHLHHRPVKRRQLALNTGVRGFGRSVGGGSGTGNTGTALLLRRQCRGRRRAAAPGGLW